MLQEFGSTHVNRTEADGLQDQICSTNSYGYTISGKFNDRI